MDSTGLFNLSKYSAKSKAFLEKLAEVCPLTKFVCIVLPCSAQDIQDKCQENECYIYHSFEDDWIYMIYKTVITKVKIDIPLDVLYLDYGHCSANAGTCRKCGFGKDECCLNFKVCEWCGDMLCIACDCEARVFAKEDIRLIRLGYICEMCTSVRGDIIKALPVQGQRLVMKSTKNKLDYLKIYMEYKLRMRDYPTKIAVEIMQIICEVSDLLRQY